MLQHINVHEMGHGGGDEKYNRSSFKNTRMFGHEKDDAGDHIASHDFKQRTRLRDKR